ncbi:hypothetical protein B0H34DRAFT_856072, partial [Crassisporium funariophilum]
MTSTGLWMCTCVHCNCQAIHTHRCTCLSLSLSQMLQMESLTHTLRWPQFTVTCPFTTTKPSCTSSARLPTTTFCGPKPKPSGKGGLVLEKP